MKRIGLLTSGGDASGMNAAIRAVARTAASMGVGAVGFERGYDGLLSNTWIELNSRSVSGILELGGTILKSARSELFRTEEGRKQAAAVIRQDGIDGLVVIGGNGSQTGGYLLGQMGIPVVGVASTIDNDLYGFDYTIGFDTAVNTAIDAIDRIRDVAESHDRVFVVEVMGRDNGSIALEAGLATGADIVLAPELPFSIPNIITRLRDDVMAKKKHHIIVMAEGTGHAQDLAVYINTNLPVECRATVLGYVQRGGSPTRFDRILASISGEAAVVALSEGRSSVVAGTRGGHIVLQDTLEAVTRRNLLKPELVELLTRVSI
jgi:6-phosphofructokinase 1